MDAVTMKKAKKPFSIKKMGKKQKGTTDHNHIGIYVYPTVIVICIYLSSVWRNGKVQLL